MRRIVFLNRRYCNGEAWTNRILAYARGFAELGEDVYLYYLITDKNRTPYKIDIPGVKVVNLWERDGFLAMHFRNLSMVLNLVKFRTEVVPGDKIFVYGGENYMLCTALSVCKNIKVFTEITEHPYIYGQSLLKKQLIKNKTKIIKKLDGLFVISKSLKDYFISCGILESKIHVVNMFVDTHRFEGLTKQSTEKYIAYCGAVSYDKDGVNILIKAFKIFNNKHPEFKLYIIGKGTTPDVIPQLHELTMELNIEASVVFTGLVSPEKMPQILYDASILALARPINLQSQNGFPTKLGEYLATGNPVVVTKVGEIPDFIIDKENGVLAEPDSPEDFAEKLCWVADNPEKAKEIGLEGKQLVYSSFSYLAQSEKALFIIDNYRK